MSKRRNKRFNRTKRARTNFKPHTFGLAEARSAPNTGPVHICGSSSSLDPDNPEGLSLFARQAIGAAHATQTKLTGGEIMASHMTIKTPFGWMVRACHPELDNEVVRLPNRIDDLDAKVTTPRHVNRIRMERAHVQETADEKRARLRDVRERLEAYLDSQRGE